MIGTNKFQKAKELLKNWKQDDSFQTVVSACVSLGLTILFALYNGYLGLSLLSVWHGSICVFYLFLAGIRGVILYSEWRGRKDDKRRQTLRRRRVYLVSCVLLLMLDLALIAPITTMALLEKPVDIGLVPAIAMAAYTTYKMTMASVHIRRNGRNRSGNILIAELRVIHFIDALVSVLTLQNTLIMVNSSPAGVKDMLLLTTVTSAAIYLAIVLMSVIMLVRGWKRF